MFHFVYADNRGNAYDHPEYLALGRLGQNIVEPDPEEFIPMPEGASLVLIPERTAIVADKTGSFQKYKGGLPVGALYLKGILEPSYQPLLMIKRSNPASLGYAAVAFKDNQFYVAHKYRH